MHKFKDLKVWQKSIELATQVYLQTKTFPIEEKFNLAMQINKSLVSIAFNIAEGAGRKNEREFNNFLGIAAGSSFEPETQLIIAYNLRYISDSTFDTLSTAIEEIQKMIFALQKSLGVKN